MPLIGSITVKTAKELRSICDVAAVKFLTKNVSQIRNKTENSLSVTGAKKLFNDISLQAFVSKDFVS